MKFSALVTDYLYSECNRDERREREMSKGSGRRPSFNDFEEWCVSRMIGPLRGISCGLESNSAVTAPRTAFPMAAVPRGALVSSDAGPSLTPVSFGVIRLSS
jgi:hypothetical protein